MLRYVLKNKVERLDWIKLDYDRLQWLAVVNTISN